MTKLNIFLICALGLIPGRAFSDIVYLKNESSVEGIIEKEDADKVTLNIGYGKITLNKKDVEYIQRYNPIEQESLKKSWSSLYFMRPEFIPESLKDIAKEFANLQDLRDQATKNKKESDKTKAEIAKLETDLEKLNGNLMKVSEKLSKFKPEDNPEGYNTDVNEFNSLVAKIKLLENSRAVLKKRIAALDQKISGYVNDFSLFKKRFNELYNALGEEFKVKEENRYFLSAVGQEIDELNNDFTRHTIDYLRDGLNISVDCLLNNSVKANLMLDTGSSLVVISKNIVNKLGIDTERIKSNMFITLADGQKVKAVPLILENLQVGDVELKDVKAAVLENTGASEEDGLLGMSFLENFLVKIDVKGKKLILEEFNPI